MSHNGILYNSGNECTAATQNNTDEPYYDLRPMIPILQTLERNSTIRYMLFRCKWMYNKTLKAK